MGPRGAMSTLDSTYTYNGRQDGMGTVTATVEQEYRKVRARQIAHAMTGASYYRPATCALNVARDEVALQEAERDDRVRFVWDFDPFYEPDDDDPVFLAQEIDKLNSGEWEALYCRVEVPRVCGHCGAVLEDDPSRDAYWTDADGMSSLGGIVVDVDDQYNYRREVERELAHEAGIIGGAP